MNQGLPRTPSSNVDERKNLSMNRSAILFSKVEMQNTRELPKYIAGSRGHESSSQSMIPAGSQINKNRTLLHFLEKSTKELELSISEEKEAENETVSRQRRRFPKEILNILFRQNVGGYNPYLAALKKLDELPHLGFDIRENIKRLCHIGIAKSSLRVGGLTKFGKYSRMGMLIRPYMNGVMAVKMEERRDLEPLTVYIKINSSALSFNPKRVPPQIDK